MVIVQSDSSPHIEADTNHGTNPSGTKIKGIQFDTTKPTAIISQGRQRPHAKKGLRNSTARSMRNSSLDDSYLLHTHLERDNANNLFINIYDVNKQSNSIAAGLHERHYQYQSESRQLEKKISEFIDIKNKLLLKPDPIASSSSESNSVIDSTSPVPSSTNSFYKNRANSTSSTNDESESNEDEITDNTKKVSISNEHLDNCILNLKSRSKVLASLSSDLEDEEDSIDNCAVLSNCGDFDGESCSSRRETIVFKRPADDDNPCTATVDDTTFVENSLFEFKSNTNKEEADDANKEDNITDILVKSEIEGAKITEDSESFISMQSVSRKNSADETSNRHNGHLLASSMACEVASLSSMTSNYSQFDFLNNQSDKQQQQTTRAPSPPKTHQLQKKVSNPLTSFFFPNSFFNRGAKKSAQPPSIPESPNKPLHSSHSNNKFDLITSSILSLKSKPAPATGQSKGSLHSSSSSLSNPHVTEPDRQSIRSNQSSTNLRSFFGGGSASMSSSASVHDFQPNSVLIFENRPSNLPAKSQQEALKHKQEYERMVEAAKRKEVREKEIKVKKHEQQVKKEDFMANSLRIWNTEILTDWKEAKNSKRTRQLWWHGLPPSIRGKVWKLAIGNDLGLSKDSYIYYKQKAAEKLETLSKNSPAEKSLKFHHQESSVELIKLDVSRTFPQLCFFQRDGPYHEALHSVLGAYACFNPKIGYVQGMSFLTAILLLNMEAPDAFICLANLLKTKYLTACFNMDQTMMNRYFRVHDILLEHNLPKLHKHFEEQKVKPDLYLIEWIFTLFSKSLPLDVMSRVWDVFFRDQEEFLFRTALGILSMYKENLLEMDFIHIVQFLTKLPETINSTQLFKAIEKVNTNIDEDYFTFEMLMYQVVTAPGQSKANATKPN